VGWTQIDVIKERMETQEDDLIRFGLKAICSAKTEEDDGLVSPALREDLFRR
jgi:hypothetical protein